MSKGAGTTRSRRWTDAQLVRAVETNVTIAGVIRSLGLVAEGGNYKTVWREIRRLGLSTAHIKGQGWSRGMKFEFKPKRPLSEILVLGMPAPPGLRLRLLREGLKQHRCEECGLECWNGAVIPLELDHRNGRTDDNRIENLTLLCPNCHAQTPTYRGRNIGRYKTDDVTEPVPGAGFEPTRPFDRRGLSPPRLPVTPPGRLF